MNKQVLIDGLTAKIAEDRPPVIKLFLRLLKQVWEIDWTVAPYDVMNHFVVGDLPYVCSFMDIDRGDEAEEDQLLMEWLQRQYEIVDPRYRGALMDAVNEVNMLRLDAQTA